MALAEQQTMPVYQTLREHNRALRVALLTDEQARANAAKQSAHHPRDSCWSDRVRRHPAGAIADDPDEQHLNPKESRSGGNPIMMLNLYVESQLMRRDLESWIAKQRERMLAEAACPSRSRPPCWSCSRSPSSGSSRAITALVVSKAAIIGGR